MKQENKTKKLSFGKKTILKLSGNANPDNWIKTSTALSCPSTSTGVTCFNFD